MKNKISSSAILIAIFLEIITILTGIYNIFSNQFREPSIYVVTLLAVFVPFIIIYIVNKFELLLPPHFTLVITIFIFLAQYLGEILNFYIMFKWWDLFLHLVYGLYGTVIPLYLVKDILTKTPLTTDSKFIFFIALFGFAFSITLSTMWEIIEALGDALFRTHMVKGGLMDTITDIVIGIVGASIVSTLYYYKNRLKKLDGV